MLILAVLGSWKAQYFNKHYNLIDLPILAATPDKNVSHLLALFYILYLLAVVGLTHILYCFRNGKENKDKSVKEENDDGKPKKKRGNLIFLVSITFDVCLPY